MKTENQPGSPQGKTLNCQTCGAEYPADMPNCPYCGTMNLPAAEEAYMSRLENIRGDLAGLADRENKKRSQSRRRKILILAVILALILAGGYGLRLHREREEALKDKEEYLWQREGFARMDEYYAAGEYDALLRYYQEAYEEGHRVYQYRHRAFCEFLRDLEYAREALAELEQRGGSPEWLFREELNLLSLESLQGISEEEREILKQLRAPLLEDLNRRFRLTEEELQGFRDMLEKDSVIPYAECERFLREKGMME